MKNDEEMLEGMMKVLGYVFASAKKENLVAKISNEDKKLTLVARFRDKPSVCDTTHLWFGVDVIGPEDGGSAEWSVSFYCKDESAKENQKDKRDPIAWTAKTLPDEILEINQVWFQENNFEKKEYPGTGKNETITRPKLVWESNKVGGIMNLIITFIRTWCKV